jgi:hypothetical protein
MSLLRGDAEQRLTRCGGHIVAAKAEPFDLAGRGLGWV